MATAYSGEVAIGSYNRIRLRVDYSGASASCHIEFSRTSSWTGQWADYSASITLNGTTQSSPYDYSGTVGASWIEIASASGFTVPTAGGTLSWSFNNPTAGAVLGCSGTIDIPSQGSAPSGGYINGLASHWDSANNEIVVTTTAVGVTSTGSTALTSTNWNVTEQPYTAGIARISRTFANGSASALSNSLNEYTGTTISVLPNSTYYRGLYAANSIGDYRYNGGSFTTVCAPATISLSSVADTTATFAYSTPADGGAKSKTIEYSLDGSTWNAGATVSTGSASSGTFTITGLTGGTTYNVQTRVTTTAGSTTGPTVAVTTSATVTPPTGLTVSNLSSRTDGFTGTVSITSWGQESGSGTYHRKRELQVWTYSASGLVEPRRYQGSYGDALSSAITVGNSSDGTLTIVPNTRYVIGLYAQNEDMFTGNQRAVVSSTLAATPTASLSSVAKTTATFSYTMPADGGYSSRVFRYNINNGQSVDVTTANAGDGTQKTGTFTVSNLSPNTTYVLRFWTHNDAGNSDGQGTITFTTVPNATLYGSVSGQTTKIKKLYCSVNGQTRRVKRLYASVNGAAKVIFGG